MKIFLDTANRDAIKKWTENGIIDGVTTNPTLLSKEGVAPKKVLLDICAMVPGDVSIEVTETTPQAVYNQAQEIAQLAKNVVVKIPCSLSYFPVIQRLVREGIRLNITLVFSTLQALMVAKLGVTYISPFIGRWDDINIEGIQLIPELMQIKVQHGFTTSILAASMRSLIHLHQAALAGADVATVPPELLEKALQHPLTDQGMSRFEADWKKLNQSSWLE